MDKNEAHELANAYANVAQYYPSLNLDPKYAALGNLGACISIVYGSKIMAYRMRMAYEKSERQRNGHQTASPVQAAPVPEPQNGAAKADAKPVPEAVRTGEIPGVGSITFPPDHPLMGGRKH